MSRGSFHELFDLSGRVAVVTGGAGILGRRFCAGLADFGAAVAVVDIDEEKVKEQARWLSDTFDIPSLAVICDISDPDEVSRMVVKVESELGPVDILHNNAAVKPKNLDAFFAPIDQVDMEVWREVMSVNLDGMFIVAKEVGSRMARREKGTIIQTASIYGIVAPDQRIYEGSYYLGRQINTPAVYSASKAGVVGLTRYLAAYWGERGVRVNTLTPGGVESGQNETFKSRYSARVPLARMAQPDEMVGALIFLASDASTYVTGQNLVVDGGLSVW